jgi:hypothetical protein
MVLLDDHLMSLADVGFICIDHHKPAVDELSSVDI